MIERARDLCFGFIAGLVVAAVIVAVWPRGKATESYAPEVRRPDGSVVLERQPAAKPVVAHRPPAGGKRERAVHVDVKPAALECPLCSVDLTLIRMNDGGRRVLASSATGEIVTGVDIPLLSVDPAQNWAAGVSYGQGWGGWVDRDIGRFRVGIEMNNTDGGSEVRGRVGFRFR
jgi:hypothetical protein